MDGVGTVVVAVTGRVLVDVTGRVRVEVVVTGGVVVVVAGAVPTPATGGRLNRFNASSTLTGYDLQSLDPIGLDRPVWSIWPPCPSCC